MGCDVKNDWCKIRKISDIEMYLFIQKGLTRRISYIAKRYSEANNKYLKDYDPTKPSKYIEYFDENNLYGWAMSGCLPYGGFKWLKNVDNFDVNPISEKSPRGYILEVDLKAGDAKKLISNLGSKTKYIVHYRNLQLYLNFKNETY